MQGYSDTELVPPQSAEDIVEADTGEADIVERRRPIPEADRTLEADTDTQEPTEPASTSVFDSSRTTPDIGVTVVAEARSLVEQRRFADAARVLESAERLRPDDPEVLALTAMTNAHAGRNRPKVRDALKRLSEDFGTQSLTWRTVSQVAVARFQFDPAQKAARTAVQMAPRTVDNWHSLAAAYAGNGWYDEASECMAEATKIAPETLYREHSPAPLSFGQWQIGRAVNYWALTRTYLPLIGVLAFVYFGLLGVALTLSTPMLLREIRVRQLPDPFRSLADRAWKAEHRLRLLNGIVVLGVLAAWVLVLSIRG